MSLPARSYQRFQTISSSIFFLGTAGWILIPLTAISFLAAVKNWDRDSFTSLVFLSHFLALVKGKIVKEGLLDPNASLGSKMGTAFPSRYFFLFHSRGKGNGTKKTKKC